LHLFTTTQWSSPVEQQAEDTLAAAVLRSQHTNSIRRLQPPCMCLPLQALLNIGTVLAPMFPSPHALMGPQTWFATVDRGGGSLGQRHAEAQ
jgi:hypothetical protein